MNADEKAIVERLWEAQETAQRIGEQLMHDAESCPDGVINRTKKSYEKALAKVKAINSEYMAHVRAAHSKA